MNNQNNLKVYTQDGIYLFDINFGHYCNGRQNRYINYESILCSCCREPFQSLEGLTIIYKTVSRRYKLINDIVFDKEQIDNFIGEGI
jgi:protein-disulfide isomerase